MKTIHRTVGGQMGTSRRSLRMDVRSRGHVSAGGFAGMLAKLGLASERLNRSRPRSR